MEFNQLDQWLMGLGVHQPGLRVVLLIFTVVLITGVVNLILGSVFRTLGTQLEKTKNLWDDTLLESARPPAKLFVWVMGLSLAAEIGEGYADSELFQITTVIRQIAVIYIFSWFLVRFISGTEKIVVSPEKLKEPMDETTVSAVGKLLRASVIITAVLVVLQTLGYSISGVLAFGGIGGIAVGFAAKDLLANFFGGLMVYMDRPFSVGDWIRSPDKQIEGTVEHIGWRTTRIRTFEKRPIYVPNATFTNITVENPSRMTHRRIYETIGVRYEDAHRVELILQDVKKMLQEHDEIDTSQTMIVNFNAFAASSLDFFIYTFTKTTNWIRYHEVKQDVLLKVMDIILHHGAEVAFPTSTIHLFNENSSDESLPAMPDAKSPQRIGEQIQAK
ncbi:small-conductance mechanosensitive channel [Oleiphilus messinensis]|uniref:Small-conductance mechanosensitive channel n=1 Tax=Oleiphilus messinensis TaxID=141451 RepID=A0A1Y0I937_9GAMM|nr:mechanosensitive ion channel family protein [Oleiphilus messinensis]ARU57018.1 small-conductance mechanosensitive channel [Oleiphilus messinensis]